MRMLKQAPLTFKQSAQNSEKITAKFTDALTNEVKETFPVYGSTICKADRAVAHCKLFLKIGGRYDCFGDADKGKMLCQTMGRSLEGNAEEEWEALVDDIRNFNPTGGFKTHFTKMLKKWCKKVTGEDAFDNQQEAMECGFPFPDETKDRLVENIEKVYAMQKDMVYLDPDGEEFSERQMARKIVPAFLPSEARILYVDRGGDDARTKAAVLKIVLQVQKSLKVRHSERDERDRGNDSDKRDDRGDKGNNDYNRNNNRDERDDDRKGGTPGTPSDNGGKTTSQPCRTHDGKHLWKECPDNKYSKNYNGDSSSKDDGGRRSNTNGEGELKSTEITEDSKTKSTPSVHFTYESDDESAHSGNGDW